MSTGSKFVLTILGALVALMISVLVGGALHHAFYQNGTAGVDPVLVTAHEEAAVPTAVEPAKIEPAPAAPVAAKVAPVKPDRRIAKSKAAASAEDQAYAKAFFNVARAGCLRFLVDYKFESDYRFGRIADWGSVLKKGVCDDAKVFRFIGYK